MPLTLLDNQLRFPDPRCALRDPNGLLAVGGDLSIDRLRLAYQSGIFPWFSEGEPILWWSPSVRAVLWPEQLHVSHSLSKFSRHCNYQVTLNTAFSAVINQCAKVHGETWITESIIEAYIHLHHVGLAHSVEVWQAEQLIGGLYGVQQGALFCGESMFSLQNSASKIALMAFCRHFLQYHGKLIDCQVLNPHTASLGAIEISRADYLQQLRLWQTITMASRCWQPQVLHYKIKSNNTLTHESK